MSKILVAYFSASGVTAKVAKQIADASGGELFEIQPKVKYTDADLDWQNKNSRSSIEMADENSRPEIGVRLPDIDKYDTVILGFPIWWYVAPTIINTFLESYDFSGKTIIPFATSGSSGYGKTNQSLAKSCKAKLLDGRMLNRASRADIDKFLSEVL